MIFQIDGATACAIVTACVLLCGFIMRLCLRPTEQRLDRHEKILEVVKGPDDLSNLIDKHVSKGIANHAATCPKGAPDNPRQAGMTPGHLLTALVLALLLACLACSCSSVNPVYDPSGRVIKVETAKFPFGPDVEYERAWDELAPDGKTVLHFRERYATHTTADKVATILGTLLEGWDKVKP